VVCWDPHLLNLRAPAIGGLRQHELLKDDGNGVANQRIEHFERWREAWRSTVEVAATPSVRALSVTGLAAERTEPARPVAVERCERDAGRPGGACFGKLVHAGLQFARGGDDGSTLSALVRSLGRGLGASEQESAAAEVAVARALTHPLMERALAAEARGELYREAPLSVCRQPGEVVEGVVDLAFREGATWWIVDYKTDVSGHLEARYRQQLTLYAEALERLTGEAAQCVLWLV
jgi:ATP-dependent exoDNAse (exonuclease V) beta subunit